MSDPFVVSATPSYEPKEAIPEGTHLAICTQLICLGTITKFNPYKGKEVSAPSILLGFELCHVTHEYNGQQENRIISKRYNHSLHENAALTADLISWRGKAFTPQELQGFDLGNILGKPCMITVLHAVKGDKTYANIDKITPLVKFDPETGKPLVVPAQQSATVKMSWSSPTWNIDAFNALPNYLKDVMKATPEYRGLVNALPATASASQPAQLRQPESVATDIEEDMLPF